MTPTRSLHLGTIFFGWPWASILHQAGIRLLAADQLLIEVDGLTTNLRKRRSKAVLSIRF